MWSKIERYFQKYPAQARVARLLFERGFQVREDGKVVSGNIVIPYTQIAKEAGVERRAVASAVRTILSVPELKKIYSRLKQVCLLQETARAFGLSVITFVPENARRPGIIAEVTRIISEKGLTIVQAYAEDPDVSPEPKFIVVIQGEIPHNLIKELRRIPGARSITIY
ncbi:MAG: amino acid-binding protein [Thermoprotei archaeon]|nr:amino acid-binding protein [Thermoprotei archaeon]